ncbi:MAG: ferritin-like domain-containing protein [Deltaproteobacteria bacterium]|nr:ferritin-like domain-containing protein [Deltaproteobacteria bacterium]
MRRLHLRLRRSPLPIEAFGVPRPGDLDLDCKLEALYHRGQEKIWAGKPVLDDLRARYGPPRLAPGTTAALQSVLAVILWGELAAWKVSADLALQIDDFGAKMAATSQAHDEARHFTTMRDYLALHGAVPRALGPASRRMFDEVLLADTTAKKLLGMQFMVEPMALTIFMLLRRKRVEPVLTDLLVLYERDEARHVGLGVLHLPAMVRGMGPAAAADFHAWQLRAYFAQFALLREISGDLRALGISPRDALRIGREKQLAAANLLAKELGHDLRLSDIFRRVTDFVAELDFPVDGEPNDLLHRLGRGMSRAMEGVGEFDERLSEVA